MFEILTKFVPKVRRKVRQRFSGLVGLENTTPGRTIGAAERPSDDGALRAWRTRAERAPIEVCSRGDLAPKTFPMRTTALSRARGASAPWKIERKRGNRATYVRPLPEKHEAAGKTVSVHDCVRTCGTVCKILQEIELPCT